MLSWRPNWDYCATSTPLRRRKRVPDCRCKARRMVYTPGKRVRCNTSGFESAILRRADLPELGGPGDRVAGLQRVRHLAGVRADHVRTPGPRHRRCRRPAWIAQPAMLGSLPFLPRFPADWRFSALDQARVGGADDGFES